MIAGAADCRRHRPRKAQIDKGHTVYKGVDDANKTIRSNIASMPAGSRLAWVRSDPSMKPMRLLPPVSACRISTI